MRVRNNTFLLILLMMISSISFSQDILPSSLREKVYILFSDEVNPKTKSMESLVEHKKEQRYLVTYTDDEYFMVHLGTDNLYQGNYEYNMRKGYHNIPWGIVAHNTHMNDEHDMFHLVLIPHDSMSGMFIVLGYKDKSEEPTGGGSSSSGSGMGKGMKKGESINIYPPEAIHALPQKDMPYSNIMGGKHKGDMDCKDCKDHMNCKECKEHINCSDLTICQDHMNCKGCNDHMKCKKHMNCDMHQDCKDHMNCAQLMDCKDCKDHMNCKECKEHMNCSDLTNCQDHMNCKGCNDHMKCKKHMNCNVHMDCEDHMKCMPSVPLCPSKPTGSSSNKMMKKNFFMHSGTYKRLF